MKTSITVAAGLLPLLASEMSSAQSRGMMDGGWGSHWMNGDYGSPWLSVLVIAALAGVIVWLVLRRRDK